METPFDPSEYEATDSGESLSSSSEDRIWALLAHLSFFVLTLIGPLIIWLIKKDDSPFVEDQAKEALNFQLSVMLVTLGLGLLFWLVIPMFLIPIVAIGSLVFTVLAAVQAGQGIAYRYPLNIRMIK